MSQSAEPIEKQGRFGNKFMISVWWNFEQVTHFEIVLHGQHLSPEPYYDQLDRIEGILL